MNCSEFLLLLHTAVLVFALFVEITEITMPVRNFIFTNGEAYDLYATMNNLHMAVGDYLPEIYEAYVNHFPATTLRLIDFNTAFVECMDLLEELRYGDGVTDETMWPDPVRPRNNLATPFWFQIYGVMHLDDPVGVMDFPYVLSDDDWTEPETDDSDVEYRDPNAENRDPNIMQ